MEKTENIDGRTWVLYDYLNQHLASDVEVFTHGPFQATVNINGADYMRAEITVSDDCRRIDLPWEGYLTR